MIRKAQAAGQFYPASASGLDKQIKQLIEENAEREDALGLLSPHAGYIYSGKVAACCFSRIKLTKTVVILGPNHTSLGAPFSIVSSGRWQTPLGNVEINSSLAKEILKASKYLQEDSQAHTYEHSIEVQLPFLQHFLAEVKIVPIVVSIADFKTFDQIGKAIAEGIKKLGEKILVIASSDMTHYEPQQKAKANDNLAIEAILQLDGRELLERIRRFNITMCGYGPVISMLSAVKALGAKGARLLKYETSGKTSGDYSSVVGYAGIVVQ
ncbi:MAG: AmmeMemoRadiSam system protein B [Omnitrophica bacterium]|nr:AmmeMemoRadiSam system protein B [Candidatus Omnitrophota bacterium]